MTSHALTATLFSVDPFGGRSSHGSGAAQLVLAAFAVSFLAIRTSARLSRHLSWWPGSVRSGDVHIHHLVWGICLMMLSGFLAFALVPAAPWTPVIAVLFGVGAGFTMDEFALWVHLKDVYWQQEGRRSIDATVVAAAFAGLVVLGTKPFGLEQPALTVATAVVVAVVLGLTIMCFMKGRILLGVVGLFAPAVAVWGAVRLGQPGSPWARRRYSSERLERSRARFATDRGLGRWRGQIADLVTGAPVAPAPPAPAHEPAVLPGVVTAS
ncbi:MAG TPA: hypothetical protein VGO71_08490 [Baekduia sp.]|jgi:hypothetical protein|nr:hypothetical protein [Baekduia sp.]